MGMEHIVEEQDAKRGFELQKFNNSVLAVIVTGGQ